MALQAQNAQRPTQVSNGPAGTRFRAFVTQGPHAGIEDLKLLPIRPREVVVRTEASAPCYTICSGFFTTRKGAPPGIIGNDATILNHSGVGVVEAVGPQVQRVQVGDRVLVPGTPYCGQCYQCLHGRPDWCQFLFGYDRHPIAEMTDGTPVFAALGLGGLSERMVVVEEYCVPLFTKVPAAELSTLGDAAGAGLSAATVQVPVEPGSDVVVMGAGPVGLGAVQGARIMGAGQIIVVEPIKYRREMALKLGATTVLDPNAEGNNLVERIREICKGPTDRLLAGGRIWPSAARGPAFATGFNRGPDLTIEATGGTQIPPKVEAPPDPTGILPLQQAWEFTRAGGHIIYLGFLQRGNVSYPAMALANFGRTIHAGQMGGMNVMRDLPRFVKLIEKGEFDAKSIVTATYPLDRTLDAMQAVIDRTSLTTVVTFS